jgi:DNA-binding MarR family transcriptional regulator
MHSTQRGESRQSPYGFVYTEWVLALRDSPNLLSLMCLLATYADARTLICFPSVAILATQLNMQRTNVYRALRTLLRRGFILVVHSGRKRSY